MDPTQRFEILASIASGDFATVYRARDRELGREVAIKQIHPQFLQDPRQLERYWQEAQLLASLEHPHIMTIYDIVRDRGWLVLELMQGSLQQLLGGRPIDLNDLRMSLTYIAHALQFMHRAGIVHGDVKPSNLLVDKNHRVKLGDFGIARRIAGEHGSVVKGTTKYMAPEVVSDQFGPIGPHSDLYSLGFSAYELLCGENFESLFPGLNLYGRDRQVAWMMWHSTPDRRLPEIAQVLQGVPPDLAFIIQKLTQKDPKLRYRSADQLIEDLQRGATQETGPSPEQIAAAEAAAKAARNKRRLTIGAFVFSASLSLAMAFWPDKPKPVEAPPSIVKPTDGIVGEVDLQQGVFFLRQGEGDLTPKGITIREELDRIFVNKQPAKLADLRRDDLVAIKYLISDGEEFIELYATRPEEKQVNGKIASVMAADAELTLTLAEGESPVPWYAPNDVVVTINDQRTVGTRPMVLADLRPEDRVTVSYIVQEGDRNVARSIVALRTLNPSGTIAGRNPAQSTISLLTTGGSAGAKTQELQVARECVVVINGQDKAGDVPLTIADLTPGDRVKLVLDTRVHRIEASRDVQATGAITAINHETRAFTVMVAAEKSQQFVADAQCEITGPQPGGLEFSFLRAGDEVQIEYAPLDQQTFKALKIAARPVADPRSWAIVIGQEKFDDAQLPPLPHVGVDSRRLRDELLNRYRVPSKQLLSIENGSRLQIQQGLAAMLPSIPAEAQLICYVASHAVVTKNEGAVIATAEFDRANASETGVSLKWLVKQLEECPSREKILLLDTCHPVPDALASAQPSTAEQAESVKEKPTRPVSTNVLVIASCDKGQRELVAEDGSGGLFGRSLAKAFHGDGDANRDGRVAVNELLEFLPKTMAAGGGAGKQSPVVFPPDNRPPRLTVEAKDAVRKMLGYLRANRFDQVVTSDYQSNENLLPRDPDLALAYGLVLLRNNRTPWSRPLFEKVRLDHPKAVVAHQALAWHSFVAGKPQEGIAELRQMIEALPDVEKNPAAAPYVRGMFTWAGALRQFAISASEPSLMRSDVEELDQAVAARGDDAKELYRQGVEAVREAVRKLDAERAEASPEKRSALGIDRRRVTFYTTFNFALVADFIRQNLDE